MHRGKGPSHINLITLWSHDFSVKQLPEARVIKRVSHEAECPELPKGRIGIFIGSHSKWSPELTAETEKFCEKYNAVVLSDHTGNYKGKFGVLGNLIYCQENRDDTLNSFDLIIHLGNVSGAYFTLRTKTVWRVDADGDFKDTFRKLKYVFEMDEKRFFEIYNGREHKKKYSDHQYNAWRDKDESLRGKMPELPLSNIWIAKQTIGGLPMGAELHLGILNTLRSWSLFNVPKSVNVYSNTGGFGIDGCVSSLIGASLYDKNKLYFGVVGDLAFFYDMNAIGNRNIGNNVRLILINNGLGTEFKNYNNNGALFGDDTDLYIAAGGHYGNKSRSLVKDYVTNLGFEYYKAESKEEYTNILPVLLSDKAGEKPVFVEVFTDCREESNALKIIRTLDGSKNAVVEYSKPKRFSEKKKYKYVAWGAGVEFRKTIGKVKDICDISLVCDNNRGIWGEEITDGVKCISPDELKEIEDVFVIIMTESYKTAFSISSQLLDMGISDYDIVGNWLKYEKGE